MTRATFGIFASEVQRKISQKEKKGHGFTSVDSDEPVQPPK